MLSLLFLHFILFFIYYLIFLESTDDTKMVSYHWEEINGLFREEKTSANSAVLHLSNLVPGNNTFRQVGSSPLLCFSVLIFWLLSKIDSYKIPCFFSFWLRGKADLVSLGVLIGNHFSFWYPHQLIGIAGAFGLGCQE